MSAIPVSLISPARAADARASSDAASACLVVTSAESCKVARLLLVPGFFRVEAGELLGQGLESRCRACERFYANSLLVGAAEGPAERIRVLPMLFALGIKLMALIFKLGVDA